MKYKVGDKVRVRSDLQINGSYGAYTFVSEMSDYKGSVVAISEVYLTCYCIEEDKGIWKWTDEMFEGLVEDELTAEEATRILGEICCENKCYNGCPIGKARGKMSCHFFRRDKPKEVIEILKQWKKDHEEKPIETESVGIVRVIEDTGFRRKCVYEEELTERENPMDAKERVLKEYCQKHVGKFFTVFESICWVKE
jgi:hypothetical protein